MPKNSGHSLLLVSLYTQTDVSKVLKVIRGMKYIHVAQFVEAMSYDIYVLIEFTTTERIVGIAKEISEIPEVLDVETGISQEA